MRIIVEGADNAGKSTLCNYLSKRLHMKVQPSEGREKFGGEMAERVARYFTYDAAESRIYDRHPVVSQEIYNNIVNNTGIPRSMYDHFYDTPNFFIYCRADRHRGMQGHKADQLHGDDPEYVDTLQRNFHRLVGYYDDWSLNHANIVYRIGDDPAPVYHAIAQTDIFNDVADFHRKFELAYEEKPRPLYGELSEFRLNFMKEELTEYEGWQKTIDGELHYGLHEPDPGIITEALEQQLDALIDLMYVTVGCGYLQGFNLREAWRRVHVKNMEKVRCERKEDSTRGSTFDVIKPPGWTPPSHTDLVEDHVYQK